MCGIWTSIGFTPSVDAIERVAHRGPDGVGHRRFESARGPVTLWHRRLSIYDLDARSAQPMQRAPDAPTIVFNGSIYNYRDLRRDLERFGHTFRTSGDTEVLLAALEQWGTGALDRLNGMFAFVVYDPRRDTLFAARDRFGVKPLHVWAGRTPDGRPGIAFASEIKQLLTVPGLSAKADLDALHDFLRHGLTDHGVRTCFASIYAIPPGHLVDIGPAQSHTGGEPLPADGGTLARRWYSLPRRDRHLPDAADAAAELASLLASAVGTRLTADVAVGSCLSGGLDSSAIVGTIAAAGQERQHCVSAVYPTTSSVDESRYVNAVTTRLPKVEAHRVAPDADHLADRLDQLIWHQDQPFGTTSIFAQWCVFERARAEGLVVMLDGQGADELFGGYRPMIGTHFADLARRGRLPALLADARAFRDGSGYTYLRQASWLAAAIAPPAALAAGRRLSGHDPMAVWLRNTSDVTRGVLAPEAGSTHGMDRLCRHMVTHELPMLLRFEDRNSMAHGIEARVPFLDYRLVEWAMRLGGQFNIRDGQSKWILRQAAAPVLPPQVLARRDKIGFATPEAQWLQGPLRAKATAGLADTFEILAGHIDVDRARLETCAMLDGHRAYDPALWRLWCVGLWAARFGVAIER